MKNSKKGEKQWIKKHLYQLGHVPKHLPKSKFLTKNAIFCTFFAFSAENVSKLMKTKVISTKIKFKDSGSIFQIYEDKSSSMSRTAVFVRFSALHNKTRENTRKTQYFQANSRCYAQWLPLAYVPGNTLQNHEKHCKTG